MFNSDSQPPTTARMSICKLLETLGFEQPSLDFGEPKASSRAIAAVMLGGFLLALSVYIWVTMGRVPLNHPAMPNDEADYENIAFHLYEGRGLSRDWDNRQWLEPYEAWNEDGKYDVYLESGILPLPRRGIVPSVYRPPAFPIAITALYNVFGRRFDVVRIMNCGFLALAVAISAGIVARLAGIGPALITIATSIADTELHEYAGTMLTESMAAMSVTILAAVLMIGLTKQRYGWMAIAGAAFGFLVLVRSIFVLWTPFLLVLVWWLLGKITSRVQRFKLITVFLMTALVVLLPWWIRNCMLLHSLSPTGTQGPIGLAGGYSDASYSLGGDWNGERQIEIMQGLMQQAWYRDLTPLEQEHELARESMRQVWIWISENWEKLPVLAAGRLFQTWWRASVLHMLFYLPVLVGAVAMRRSIPGKILIGFLVINSLVVMATYSAGGRFLVPMRPLMHTLAGVGGWTMLSLTLDRMTGASRPHAGFRT